MLLTKDAEKLIELLCGAGYKAYAVGGCVRDSMLNRPVSDIDICTSAKPNEVESVLEENGIKFLIRNFQEESLVAGWAAGTIKGDASVFVFTEDYDKAMLLLDEINAAEMEGE